MARPGRLQFIDFTRGIAMVIMAWDHVSGFWNQVHGGLEGIMKTRIPNLDLAHFMARFITHVCAPSFVFLAGTSIALMEKSRTARGVSQRDISMHLIVRGFLLIALDFLWVAPSFDLPRYAFGVIACIGACFIIFSLARRLPPDIILILSVFTVLNHEFLDLGFIPDTVAWGHYLRVVLHEPGYSWMPYVGFYPVIPWIGVMGIGYWFGSLLNELSPEEYSKLKTPLAITGVASIVLFFVVRYFNWYGNLVHRWGNDVMDWLYISKYPPSLAFLLWTLGWMCLILSFGVYLSQKGYNDNRLIAGIRLFGRNPLFFYLVHLWLYRFRLPGQMPSFYLSIPQTVIVWAVGLVVLWIITGRYEIFKRAHPESLLRYI